MAEAVERELTEAEIEAKLAVIRAKGIGTANAKSRGGKEKGIKGRIKRTVLTKTWRSGKFTFRCREDLIARIKTAAKEDGVAFAVWMEEAIEAALSRPKETKGDAP